MVWLYLIKVKNNEHKSLVHMSFSAYTNRNSIKQMKIQQSHIVIASFKNKCNDVEQKLYWMSLERKTCNFLFSLHYENDEIFCVVKNFIYLSDLVLALCI